MARYIDVDKIDFSVIKDPAIRIMAKRFILNKPTADVVPKSEVDILVRDLRFKNIECDQLRERITKAKQEVASEIFEEIRNRCCYSVAEHDGAEQYHTKCYSIMATKLDELEKQYTESEGKE